MWYSSSSGSSYWRWLFQHMWLHFFIFQHPSQQYGTASLVKSEFTVENIQCDSQGRVFVFDIGELSFANCYLNSGTDARSKSGRENICSEVLPSLLINSKASGCCGGDFNCITKKNDATKNPESKMSKCLERLIKLKEWQDRYRTINPTTEGWGCKQNW